MKKLFTTIAVLAIVCSTANAQSFLDRLKDRAKEAAEQNISNKVEKGVNDLLDGNFGKKKDKKDKKADESAKQEASGSWTCEECGKTGNTGKFCADCGEKRPEEDSSWTCECGAKNQGKFCQNCGKPKPAGAPLYKCDKCGWEPEDPYHPPKFCPECGDIFDDNDKV